MNKCTKAVSTKLTIKQSIKVSFAISLSLTTPYYFANETSSSNRMIITANQLEQNINDTLTDVELIDSDDIERIQPQSLTDLLVNIAGIDSVQKGGLGQDSSIFSRGTNSNQMLILLDGVRVGSATLGVKSVANISVSQIESIEIVKGPRAALWGSDAIGGVIQIFTKRYANGEHRISLTTGSNATRSLDASFGMSTNGVDNTLSYSHKSSNGIDAHIDAENDKDGYDVDSLSLTGDYQFDDSSSLDWVAQLDKGDTDFDTPWGGNIINHNNYLWNLRYSFQAANWNNQLSINTSRDQSISFGNGVSKADAGSFETRRQQYSLLTSNQLSDSVSFGAGVDVVTDNVDRSTAVYTESERSTTSAHINAVYTGDALLGEFAIRYDDVENIASNTTLNLGIGYRFDRYNQLSLNFGEGFKAPTFNDLYFPYGGNADLKFETSTNKEIVYKGFYDIGSLVVSAYESEVDDLIQWIPNADGIWAPQNIGAADISGIDLSYKFGYGNFDHKLTASSVNTKDRATGMQLLLRAKKRFGYELSYSDDGFSIFTQVQYVGERPDTHFQTYSPTLLSSYTQINLGLSYEISTSWSLKLKVSDALDKAPTLVSGYNPSGREYYLTLVHSNLL